MNRFPFTLVDSGGEGGLAFVGRALNYLLKRVRFTTQTSTAPELHHNILSYVAHAYIQRLLTMNTDIIFLFCKHQKIKTMALVMFRF